MAKPGFMDPTQGDFRLKADSAAVDAGKVAMPYPAEDRDGAPRIRGKAPDIGPFEQGQ